MMNVLKEESEKLGIMMSYSQLEKFKIYMDFLLEYNSHTNLTAIKTPDDIMIKHFLDSLILNKFLKINSGDKVVDVGTGAGFPGVPLKILKQDINLTLVDSLNKRVTFLRELLKKINLQADVFHARAEDLVRDNNFRDKFDVATARAVAPLNILCEYCLPYVKAGGCFVALKGPDVTEEVENSSKALQILGGKIERVESFKLPEDKGRRSIIIIRKINETPINYPRSNSQISKSPL